MKTPILDKTSWNPHFNEVNIGNADKKEFLAAGDVGDVPVVLPEGHFVLLFSDMVNAEDGHAHLSVLEGLPEHLVEL